MTADDVGVRARARRSRARVGWASAAMALFAGSSAIAKPDIAGVLVLAALVSTGTATLFLGAPVARAGRSSQLKIALLLVAGAAGCALAVAIDPIIAIGVVYVSYVIAILTRTRRRGSARGSR